MRPALSLLLLLVQFQPFAAVALCAGFARADAELMEDGCPMPDSDGVRLSRQSPESSAALTAERPVHSCLFADACLSPSPALTPVRIFFRSLPLRYAQGTSLVRPLHGSDDIPPPNPPPNR